MKYLPLLLANLRRKKLRTLLTVGSFAVALFLFGILAVIGRALTAGVGVTGADRLIVRNRVSIIMPMPYAYREQIRRLAGVRQVTFASWFGGVYQDERNFFAQMAVDTETWLDVYSNFRVPGEEWQAFLADRQGAVAGRDLAERFGWKLGDRIPIRGTIFPGTWEFNLCGIYQGESPEDPTMDFWFHYDYLEERRPFMKGMVGWYIVRVDDPAGAAGVAAAIDERFVNSPWETRSESEKAFIAGFAKQIGNIRLLLLTVGGIVFFTLMLVSGNTMAIAVRERIGELAVMRTLGFSRAGVLALLVAEATLLAGIGGGLGVLLAKLFTLGGDPTHGLLPLVYLAPREMAGGLLLALVVGSLSGLVTGAPAVRGPIAGALRGV